MNNIRIYVTGGTIDKKYNPITEKTDFKKTSHIEDMLKTANSAVDISIETLMLKDSLEMTDEDRKQILNKCYAAPEKQIVITHGTSTMAKTAKVLGESIKNKTIILTGAMTPYSLGNSDALFNLGGAVIAAQTLPCGVYIAMNGKTFAYSNVAKNEEKGIFETISS